MTIPNVQNADNGEIVFDPSLEELEEPLIKDEKRVDVKEEDICDGGDKGSIGMVLLSTAVAVCGSFEFGMCVGYSAPTQSAIREDLNLSIAQFSTFGSILTIGAMIGAITSGRIADFAGRKGAIRIAACFCLMGWLAVYFAKGPVSLDFGRLFTGYGIGVLSYVVPVLISEMSPQNLRGGLSTLNQLMIVTGSSVSYLAGAIIKWRMLALAGLVPCVLLLLGLFIVPESPRWLAKVGREKEFEKALRKLRGKNADISDEAAEIQECIDTLHALPKARMLDLFQRRYVRSVIIGVGLMALQQFIGINGIGFYASETFVSAGFSGKVGTILYGMVQVPITLVGALLMDKCGRRPLVMVSAAGTCIGCIMTGTSFLFKAYNLYLDYVPLLAVSGVLTYISAFSIGFGAVPWVIMSEVYPLHLKGAGGSLVSLMSWSGAWLISFTFNFLLAWSAYGTFYIYAAVSLLSIIFVLKYVPETKGKTLEEIQDFIDPDKLLSIVIVASVIPETEVVVETMEKVILETTEKTIEEIQDCIDPDRRQEGADEESLSR